MWLVRLMTVGCVADRRIVDAQVVGVIERIADGNRKIARKAHLAVRREQSQFDADGAGHLDLRGCPDLRVEPFRSAVQSVRRVIDRYAVGLSVQRELAVRDPIGVPTDQRAKEGFGMEVAVEVIEAESHVVDVTVLVRHHDRLDRAAIGDDVHFHAVCVLQVIHLHRLAVRHFPERRHVNGKRRRRDCFCKRRGAK